MYRYHTNFLPKVFSGYFVATSTIHSYNTRSSSKLHILYARTDIMLNQLRVHGPKLWNSIDQRLIRDSKNWHSFKRSYKNNYYIAMYNHHCFGLCRVFLNSKILTNLYLFVDKSFHKSRLPDLFHFLYKPILFNLYLHFYTL